jgi:hypothetical protein
MAEEIDERAFAAGGILIHEDADHSTTPERFEHRSERATLVDQLHAGPAAEAVSHGVEPREVERSDDHRETVISESMGGAQDLPVAEVRREKERAPVRGHRRLEMLGALERDSRQRRLERIGEETWQLDERHAELLCGTAGKAPSFGQRELRVGAGEILKGDTPAARQRDVSEVTDTPAKPQGERQRDPAGGTCDDTRR